MEKVKTATPSQDLEKYVKDSVFIEPVALEEEFVRMPADLAYWGAQYARSVRGYLIADMEFDRTEAEVRILVRERLLSEAAPDPSEKPAKRGTVTESMVAAKVELDEDYQAARLALIEAEAEKVRVYGIVEAVKAKRDMLISLGANQRAEMKGDPVLRRDAQERRSGRED